MPDERNERILETDLFQPVSDYLIRQGYTVHSEVKNCDITAVKDRELIVIELKTGFNITLIMQAVRRQRVTDSVYIAIPWPRGGTRSKNWDDMCHLLRRLELGLIVVRFIKPKACAEVIFHPAPFNRTKNARMKYSIIREIEGRHDNYNVGGSVRSKLMTAYRENAIHIACCLEKFGPLKPSQLKKMGTGTKTQSILTKNFYGWFEKVDKGIYQLHPDGRTCLEQYRNLADHYRELLKDKTI